jgi:hypothetical protein
MYESEHTKFMHELFQRRPQLAAEQQAGRAIFWDRPPMSLEERRRADESRIKQKPYPYQTKL